MQRTEHTTESPKTPILIVDDSLVFRRFLRDILEDCPDIAIVGEAQNGIEALEMMLKTSPAVILLDMEMPLMDGMTALQHLMIHRPTPTIMFSSLTEEGTARCFDTIKNGAVDFLSKDFIFQKKSLQAHKQLLIDKVHQASRFHVKPREPVLSYTPTTVESIEEEQRVVFCEDCGNRVVFSINRNQPIRSVTCNQCGDTIDISFSPQSQFRRNTFITVVGGGEGCFSNLLELVPKLDPAMGGSLIVVIHQNSSHVNNFTEYLDAISAMKVVRAREGISIEGGTCYIFSGQDYLRLKPFNAQLTLQKLQKATLTGGPLDVMLASVSTIFKKRAAGVILSGDRNDGDKGIAILMKNGGTPIVLDADACYCKGMGQNILDLCPLERTYSTDGIIEIIKKLHFGAKDIGVAS